MNYLFTQIEKMNKELKERFKDNTKQIGRIYAVIGTLFLFSFEFFAKFTKMNSTNIIFIRGLADSFLCIYFCNLFPKSNQK
jgi:hypothetical protein